MNGTINHAEIINLVQQGVQLAPTSDITIQRLYQELDLMKQMIKTTQNLQQSKPNN